MTETRQGLDRTTGTADLIEVRTTVPDAETATRPARLESIRAPIRSEHPYKTPEVFAVPVVSADPAYAAWVIDTVADDGSAGPELVKDER